MLIAIFADIHANRQAFTACLENSRALGADRMVVLGDLVGYGGDPDWTVTTVMNLVDKGAIALLGNHDEAIGNPGNRMNVAAEMVLDWTRGELGQAQRKFLADLPYAVPEADRLYVHASADRPEHWTYVLDPETAARSIRATEASITFCGHVHRPALYSLSAASKLTSFSPVSGVAVPLLPGRRWLAVLGSVGQPRDGNPAAAYTIYDTERQELKYCRVPYDVQAAADRILQKRLPTSLADRLFRGN